MSNFTLKNIFDSLFTDNSTSESQRLRRRSRTCRIEELESREMLHAGFLGSVLDLVPSQNGEPVVEYNSQTAGNSVSSDSPMQAPDIAAAPVPSGFSISSTNTSSVTLTWTHLATNDAYNIRWRISGSGEAGWQYPLGGTTGENAVPLNHLGGPPYPISGIAPQTTIYDFQIKAHDVSGWSAWSASIQNPSRPGIPTLSTGTVTATSISLSWSEPSGATSYTLQCSLTGVVGSYTNIATTVSTSYTHDGLSPNTTYYYQVIATNAAGSSNPSSSRSATTLCNAPTGLVSPLQTATSISLEWNAPSGGGNPPAYYQVQRYNGIAWTSVANITGTSYTDRSLTPGTTYNYRVYAVNSADVPSTSYANISNATLAPPDLAASNGGSVTPNPVIKGKTFTVTTGTISNIGSGVSGDYSVTFYASTESGTLGTIYLGVVDMASLAAGESTTAILDCASTAGLAVGTT